MKEAGIEKAWIGLPNWEQGFMQPNFVTKAKEMGYLVGRMIRIIPFTKK